MDIVATPVHESVFNVIRVPITLIPRRRQIHLAIPRVATRAKEKPISRQYK
jgi:hypothetical protein